MDVSKPCRFSTQVGDIEASAAGSFDAVVKRRLTVPRYGRDRDLASSTDDHRHGVVGGSSNPTERTRHCHERLLAHDIVLAH